MTIRKFIIDHCPMYLFINTSGPEKIILALLNNQGEFVIKKNILAKYKQSEKLLISIDKLVKSASKHKGLKLLKGILVVKGHGSFTALRIGVATANTLAFALGIPVVGILEGEEATGLEKLKSKGLEWVVPVYGQEPNIG